MTSQEREDNKGLIEQAKVLKIKAPHLLKLENLKKAVEEVGKEPPVPDNVVKVETKETKQEAPRKQAPRMSVEGLRGNDRNRTIERLERENPGYKYIYQNASISDAQLAQKGMERTEHTLKNDIIVRTDRDSFAEWQSTKRDVQYEMMKSIDVSGDQIKQLDEQPKAGK